MSLARLRRLATWGLGAAVLVAAPPPDIRVTPLVTDGSVSVSFTVPEAVGPPDRDLVQSGLLMTLTFAVDLKEPSTAWLDRTIAQVTVGTSVKFDNLTGVYHVSRLREGHVVWSERTSDFGQARAWLTTFDRIPVSTTAKLRPNAEYYVRVRMRTTPRRTFPLWPWASDDSSGRAAFTFIP